MKNFLKNLRTSAAMVLAVGVGCVIHAIVTRGDFWPVHIFTANLVVGAFIVLSGLVVFMLPIKLPDDKLIDHTTYTERIMEARERKRVQAYNLIYIGLINAAITLVVQFLLSLIWR